METDVNVKSQDSSNKAKVILSVDDDDVNQTVIEFLLNGNDYTVIPAMDGIEAFDYLKSAETLPDLILLDVMMPKLSGYEVCTKLREIYAPWIPIIMISAKCAKEDIVRGLSCGCNDYVTKPFDKEELLSRIDSHVRLNTLREEQIRHRIQKQILANSLPKGNFEIKPETDDDYALMTITVYPEIHSEFYKAFIESHCAEYRLLTIPTNLPIFHSIISLKQFDRFVEFSRKLFEHVEQTGGDSRYARIHISHGASVTTHPFNTTPYFPGIISSQVLYGKIVEEHIILLTKPSLVKPPESGYMKSSIICHLSMKTVLPGSLSEHDISIESKFNFCRIFLKNLLPLSSSGIPPEPRRAVNTIAIVTGSCGTAPGTGHRNHVVNELELVVRARANARKNGAVHARDFSDKAIKIIQDYDHLTKEETFSSIEALLTNMKAAINEDLITDSSADEVMEKRRLEFLKKCPPEIHHLNKKIKLFREELNALESEYPIIVNRVNKNFKTILDIESLNEILFLEIQRRQFESPRIANPDSAHMSPRLLISPRKH